MKTPLVNIFIFIFILPSIAFSADGNSPFTDPVIVSAQRLPLSQGRIAESVVVYTQEDLERLPVDDLSEALRYIPGVDVRVNGKFGQGTAISIRGSNSRQVLVMVDGIPFNTQLSGQANPTKIPLENVKQIEVIKGAMSSSWGSSLGGVINVITKDAGDSSVPHGQFKTSFAEFSTTKNSLELSGAVPHAGYYLSGSYMETEGSQPHSDVEEEKIFGKLAHSFNDEVTLTGSYGYSGARVHSGIPRNNRFNSVPYYSRYGQATIALDREELGMNAAVKFNDQDITTDIFNATSGSQLSSTVSRNVYYGVSLNSHYLFDDDILVLGADFDWSVLKSNNFLNNSKSVATQAPYISYSWRQGDWDFIPGLRYDNNQQFGDQSSPSFGVIYHVPQVERTLFRGKVSRNFNAPPLLNIFNEDPAFLVAPNPDLEAERAWVYEVGLATQIAAVGLDLSLYRADVKDAIATVFENGSFLRKNFRKFRRQGAEMTVSVDVFDGLTLVGSGAFNDVENRETKQTVRDQDIARQSYSLGIYYSHSSGFHVDVNGSYNRWSSAASLEPNDRKFLVDVSLRKEFEGFYKDLNLEIFTDIFNVTNSKYWSSITFPYPGRYFRGGIRVKF